MKDGDRLYLESDGEVLLSRSTDDRVAQVLRSFSTTTWLEYRGLRDRLHSVYGEPADDNTYFPEYADDNDSRETAVRIGAGQVVEVWEQPGFQIWLVYTKDTLLAKYKCAGTTLANAESEQF